MREKRLAGLGMYSLGADVDPELRRNLGTVQFGQPASSLRNHPRRSEESSGEDA